MFAEDRSVGLADFAQAVEIFLLVDNIPGQTHEVFRTGIGLGQHVGNVLKRLFYLADKIVGKLDELAMDDLSELCRP